MAVLYEARGKAPYTVLTETHYKEHSVISMHGVSLNTLEANTRILMYCKCGWKLKPPEVHTSQSFLARDSE